MNSEDDANVSSEEDASGPFIRAILKDELVKKKKKEIEKERNKKRAKNIREYSNPSS